MAAIRTQIYLTPEQRDRLDDLRRREGKTLAELVREALDSLLARKRPADEAALSETFGAAPRFAVPSRNEWGGRD